jgi:hypothetical protein
MALVLCGFSILHSLENGKICRFLEGLFPILRLHHLFISRMSLPALARLETKSCMLVIDVDKRLSLAGPAGVQLMARRKLTSQLLLYIDQRMFFI